MAFWNNKALNQRISELDKSMAAMKMKVDFYKKECIRSANRAALARQETAYLQEILCRIDKRASEEEIKEIAKEGLRSLREPLKHPI
jgi:hypothetical protein